MRSLHLTIMIFCHVLLASFILYSTLTTASPVIPPPQVQPVAVVEEVSKVVAAENKPAATAPVAQDVPVSVVATVPNQSLVAVDYRAASAKANFQPEKIVEATKVATVPVVAVQQVFKSPAEPLKPVPEVEKKIAEPSRPLENAKPFAAIPSPLVAIVKQEPALVSVKQASPVEAEVKPVIPSLKVVQTAPLEARLNQIVNNHAVAKQPESVSKPQVAFAEPKDTVLLKMVAQPVSAPVQPVPVPMQLVSDPMQPVSVQVQPVSSPAQPVSAPAQPVSAPAQPVSSPAQPVSAPTQPVLAPVSAPVQSAKFIAPPATVKGGLGPLHLLAATLCAYQPEKLVADDTLNMLYSQRASLRKSLFDFMSLKFTNLEKLSSRLNAGFPSLEVVPPKKSDSTSVAPSHGWPVVGVCTAHDLKLMAEAAWCDSVPAPVTAVTQSTSALDDQEPRITSNQHRSNSARSLESQSDQSSVISKILHVTDIKDAPIIESSLASLNLTQQQFIKLQEAQVAAASPRECRRNSLRLTKALLNHLAEDQKTESNSWPKLYAQLADDECARKRMIDVVTALAGFRGESSSIRRDNVEFAFAMDDLRAKVLESEVNTPLTFDKQFIEVEQFLQQSVKLMLANIDPERARLTSMRYRSLMPGPVAADDQCIELHQRLLAKNYPTDCNPTQFGQLPDVLRMAANSLALWSIEKELSKYSAKFQEYPTASVGPQLKQDVNECIANLVSS